MRRWRQASPDSDQSADNRATRLAWSAVFVLAAALLVAPWFGHFDDTDAQLYQVVVRTMAERRNWFDPAYLAYFAPHYREHLPFGLWPFACLQVGFGEWAPRVVAALFSLATLAGVGLVGRKLMGEWPAIGAVGVLAMTETFFRYGAATRLDPLLVLLANGAAVPTLLGTRRGHWLAAALAVLAVLVKGPFGLVPLVAAAVARAAVDRSVEPLLRGGIAAVVASLVLGGLLLLDKVSLHAGWWETYGRGQVLASAMGSRMDGSPQWWFPFASVAGRFWPGLALIAVLALPAVRSRITRTTITLLALFCLVMLVELCVPGRKVWNHTLVVYPGLALLAGAALLPAQHWLRTHGRSTAVVLLTTAGVVVVAMPVLGKLVDGTPCVGSLEFRTELNRIQPGKSVLVVSSPTSWHMLASLAAERRLEPEPLRILPEGNSTTAEMAIVQEDLLPSPLPGWRLVQRAQGWALVRHLHPD
jgi:4-amino-4-deoxy-L-arabinose transferase-like glycosyltransferase